jgi:hypothetical protein
VPFGFVPSSVAIATTSSDTLNDTVGFSLPSGLTAATNPAGLGSTHYAPDTDPAQIGTVRTTINNGLYLYTTDLKNVTANRPTQWIDGETISIDIIWEIV